MLRNESYMSKIEAWNSDLAETLLPNTIFLGLCLLIGIVGNGLTLIVYQRRMKITNERFLIPVLAVFDLLASAFTSSFEILQQQWQVIFQNTDICKSLFCVSSFFTLMSVSGLTIIAVQRFMKLYRPAGSEMTRFQTYVALSLSCVYSILLSLPPAIFYGSADVYNKKSNFTGKTCGKIKESDETGFLIYGSVMVLTLISTITVLIFIYSKIGYTLYRHFKISKSKNETNTQEIRVVESVNIELKENMSREKGHNLKSSANMDKRNSKLKYKLTLTFMVITIVFIISYVPFVILLLVEGFSEEDIWEDMTDSTRNGLIFLHQLIIINSVINPFVYAFMDTTFRVECVKLFSCQ